MLDASSWLPLLQDWRCSIDRCKGCTATSASRGVLRVSNNLFAGKGRLGLEAYMLWCYETSYSNASDGHHMAILHHCPGTVTGSATSLAPDSSGLESLLPKYLRYFEAASPCWDCYPDNAQRFECTGTGEPGL